MNNKKLRFAVIGCSPSMAVSHMEGVISAGAELYALCDSAQERLDAAVEKFAPVRSTLDYKELVNDENLDAVIIVTPDQFHREMVNAFLRAGKHVLCEKPLALTVEECEDMLKTEKETNKLLMVGQVCRVAPGFVKAKELIDAGAIGELTFIESEYAHDYSIARGYNDWRVDPRRHGVIGGGCHAIDLLRWIAGDPTEVFAKANHKVLTDWPVDDTTIAVYQFPNDVIGKVFVSIGCKRAYTMRSVFYGTKGTIITDNTSKVLTLYNGEKYTEPQTIDVLVDNHNVKGEIIEFIDAIRNNKPSPVSAYDGASTVAVCCATVESTKTGKPVEIKYPKKF